MAWPENSDRRLRSGLQPLLGHAFLDTTRRYRRQRRGARRRHYGPPQPGRPASTVTQTMTGNGRRCLAALLLVTQVRRRAAALGTPDKTGLDLRPGRWPVVIRGQRVRRSRGPTRQRRVGGRFAGLGPTSRFGQTPRPRHPRVVGQSVWPIGSLARPFLRAGGPVRGCRPGICSGVGGRCTKVASWP